MPFSAEVHPNWHVLQRGRYNTVSVIATESFQVLGAENIFHQCKILVVTCKPTPGRSRVTLAPSNNLAPLVGGMTCFKAQTHK